ncbi:MAG: MFS transporter [Lachnospiraceae bacterium]|nr:MFS transporter [Lachnospiraceae bacterium]
MSALGRTCAGVGSAIVTIVTVLAVSVLGNAAVGKSTDNETQSFDGVVTYLVELDETGAATGKVKTLRSDNGTVDSSQTALQITADRTQFTHALSFSESNCNYEIRVGDAVFNNDNSSMNFEFDPGLSDADNQVLALYVPKEVYATAAEAVSEGSADMGEREGVAVSGSITSTKEVERLGFKYFSLIVAVLFIAFILVTCTCIKEKSTVDVQTAKVGDMFKALLQNDQAMAMVITIVLVNSAVYVTSNLLIYFFKYDLGGANWQANYTLFNTFSGGIQILAMMLFFPILRRFFDTIKIFYLCIASAIGGYIILLVMALTGTNVVYPFLVPGFFIMGAVGILNVLVTIFLANTVDYGELKNHRRDESVIFSMQTFVVKLASGIAALAASVSLSVFHISDGSNAYEAAENGSLATGLQQSIDKIMKNGVSAVAGSSVIGLRFVMTVLPVAVLAVALFVFRRRYSLTDERLAEISAQLDKQRTR